jgi:hypothetical protein
MRAGLLRERIAISAPVYVDTPQSTEMDYRKVYANVPAEVVFSGGGVTHQRVGKIYTNDEVVTDLVVEFTVRYYYHSFLDTKMVIEYGGDKYVILHFSPNKIMQKLVILCRKMTDNE